MTNDEKRRISELHRQGKGYKEISALTGVPLNTVKSFCYRNRDSVGQHCCRKCGEKILQLPGTRQKFFCSDACRLAWWNSHPEQVKRSTKTHTCPQCGSSFETHIDKQRFCSRACYAASRRKGATV